MSKQSEPPEPKKRKPKIGRPSIWDESLGLTIHRSYRAPPRVFRLLGERPVKKLLNRMETSKRFKARVLALLDDEPPASEKG